MGPQKFLCVCSCGCNRRTTEALSKCPRCESAAGFLRSDLPEYDVVVVDEAHHLYRLDGTLTSLGRLIERVRRRYLILLTATPVRRDTRELYQLISLVRPGEFKGLEDFEARVARPFASAGGRQAAVGQLQSVLSRVMVRQHRRDISLDWPEKKVYRHVVTPFPQEVGPRDRAVAFARGGSDKRSDEPPWRPRTHHHLLRLMCLARRSALQTPQVGKVVRLTALLKQHDLERFCRLCKLASDLGCSCSTHRDPRTTGVSLSR